MAVSPLVTLQRFQMIAFPSFDQFHSCLSGGEVSLGSSPYILEAPPSP